MEPFSNKLCYDSKQIRYYTTRHTTSREIGALYQQGKMNFNQHGFIKKNIALSYLCRYSIKVLVYPGSAPSLKFNASIKPIYQNIGQDRKVYTRLEERTLVLLVKTCSKSCYHMALWTITSPMCPRIFHLRTLCWISSTKLDVYSGGRTFQRRLWSHALTDKNGKRTFSVRR